MESTFDPQTIQFKNKVSTRYLRIRAISGFGKDRSASLAEIGILYAGLPIENKALQPIGKYRKNLDSSYGGVAQAKKQMDMIHSTEDLQKVIDALDQELERRQQQTAL